MLSSELDFFLPPELIAQTPAQPRDQSRLLRFRRGLALEEAISHYRVCDLPALLKAGDLLVFNDTRVLRARLMGRRISGGRIEALLLREEKRNVWRALLKPSARLKTGERVEFGDQSAPISAWLLGREESAWRVRFEPPEEKSLREFLPELGQVPVPPYIRTAPREEQYQTVYAQNIGEDRAELKKQNCDDGESDQSRSGVLQAGTLDSCAAPTAGLHFSTSLLDELNARGVRCEFLTLGVGVGTFRPLQSETLEEHAMHEEEFFVSGKTARAINAQKESGGRVVAVGTTTLRVLESVCDERGLIAVGKSENISGKTAIFIRPGFRFRCADALMTNFHLPRSTLLALVAAFMEDGARGQKSDCQLTGLESVRYAYAQAIAERYRFFSFGDAMLIE